MGVGDQAAGAERRDAVGAPMDGSGGSVASASEWVRMVNGRPRHPTAQRSP